MYLFDRDFFGKTIRHNWTGMPMTRAVVNWLTLLFSMDFNMTLQGIKRKITYVASYEAIAFLCGTLGFLSFTDSSLERAGALAVFASIFAVSWNFVYNAMFESWEASRITRGRSFGRRVLHAVGFELGFLVVLMPVAAWWLGISYLHSFILNLGLNIFFLVYTFAFTWAFDRVFGLPTSAAAPQD